MGGAVSVVTNRVATQKKELSKKWLKRPSMCLPD